MLIVISSKNNDPESKLDQIEKNNTTDALIQTDGEINKATKN